MRWNSIRKIQKAFEPINLGIAVVLYLVPRLSAADDCAKGDEKDGFEAMFLCAFYTWVGYRRKNLWLMWSLSYYING